MQMKAIGYCTLQSRPTKSGRHTAVAYLGADVLEHGLPGSLQCSDERPCLFKESKPGISVG